MIKAVLIDIDNTLLDFDAYVKESMKNGFAQYGLRPYEDGMFPIFLRINAGLWQQVERGELTFDELKQTRWSKVFEELGISFDSGTFEAYFRQRLFDSAIPLAGAREMLEYLSVKYILCVASNGPWEQQVNRLRVGGMLGYFSHLFISEGIGASKPSKEFFSYSLDQINAKRDQPIAACEVMMLGDSLTADMAGGIQNGLKTCWLNRSDAPLPQSMEIDHVIKSWREIPTIL